MLSLVLCATLLAGPSGQRPASSSPEFDCPPRDEASRDEQLAAVRAQLRQAVARRDAAGVLGVTGPQIRTSFGPDEGLDFFKRALANRRDEIWDKLSAVVALGGVFETPDVFVTPYYFRCGEPAEDVVVVGERVRVRSRPYPTASVLTSVSFAILRASNGASVSGWQPVQLPDGRRGFVAARFVRSPLGYRAYLSKIDGVWRLTAFVAGD